MEFQPQANTTSTSVASMGIAQASVPLGAKQTVQVAQPLPISAESDRAIGEARVDTAFLSGVKPELGGVEDAMSKLRAAEDEKRANELAAEEAMRRAIALREAAEAKEREAQLAAETARSTLLKAQQETLVRGAELRSEKLAESAHDKAVAELTAREAARSKAEEAAALEAANMAAMEVAKAEAELREAQLRRERALAAEHELLDRAAEARREAHSATQHAANVTARAEAHEREAQLTDVQVDKTLTALDALGNRIPAPGPVDKVTFVEVHSREAPVAPVQHPQISSSNVTGGAPIAAAGGAPIATGGAPIAAAGAAPQKHLTHGKHPWQPMQTWYFFKDQPAEAAFPYIVALRFGNLRLPIEREWPARLMLRLRASGAEAFALVRPSKAGKTKLKLEGFLPLAKPEDSIQIEMLDASSFENFDTFNLDTPRVLGTVWFRVHTLVDGHLSRKNKLLFDGQGGSVKVSSYLRSWHAAPTHSMFKDSAFKFIKPDWLATDPKFAQHDKMDFFWKRVGTATRTYWELRHRVSDIAPGIAPSAGIVPAAAAGGAPIAAKDNVIAAGNQPIAGNVGSSEFQDVSRAAAATVPGSAYTGTR